MTDAQEAVVHLRVLCLDDSPNDVELTQETLRAAGLDPSVTRVDTMCDFESVLAGTPFDVVILDHTVPGCDTMDALKLAARIAPEVPCIGLSGTIGEEAAVEMIREGAHDYVLKDRMMRLPIVVTRAIAAAAEKRAHAAADAELDRNRELLRSVIDSTTDGVYVRDLQGRYLTINQAGLRTFGRSAGQVLGEGVFAVLAPEDAVRAVEQDREVLARRTVATVEQEYSVADGERRTFLLTSGPLLDHAGDPYGVFGIYRDITDRKRMEAALVLSNARLERMVHQVATVMGKVVEARDPYTQGHEVGVARISRLIAEEMGLPCEETAGIEMAALMHDVGKLAVPAELLTKPGRLSEIEFAIIKGHPQSGYDILSEVDFSWPVAEIVLQHHERMDGSGYPNGLVGDEIMRDARIVAVSDVIEAMASHRPYRPSLGMDAALAEILDHPGKYDPEVARACDSVYRRGLLTSI